MYKGSVTWESPTFWVLGFMGLFTIGGLTGLFLATMGLDIHLTDTLLRRRALPLHHGRRRDHGLHGRPALLVAEDDRPDVQRGRRARRRAILVFVGFNLTFFPQFVLGYMGMPRRYHAYPEEWQVLNVLSSAGASILALGYVLPAFYLTYSLFKGAHGAGQSVGRQGARVDGAVAAADVQLRRGPGRRRAGLQLQAGAGRFTLASRRELRSCTRRRTAAARRPRRDRPSRGTDTASTRTTRTCSTTSTAWSSSSRRPSLGMWVFLVTEIMFFGGMFMVYILYRMLYPEAWVARQQPPQRRRSARSTRAC